MVDDPDLHPHEVEFIEPVRHRVNLASGEHTIEPLDDQQVRTASIVSVGPQNPQGNVHRSGSVLIEVDSDSVNLESATRRRDANLQDPAEAEAFDFNAGPQAVSGPAAADVTLVPVADDPDLHPQEVEFIEPVRHRVNLVTGEETIEPLDDQQVRTARIVSRSATV